MPRIVLIRKSTEIRNIIEGRLKVGTVIVLILTGVTSCAEDYIPENSLQAICATTTAPTYVGESVVVSPQAGHVNELGNEEKQLLLEAEEDAKKLPELLLSFCKLGAEGRLPGIELGDTISKLDMAHARGEIRQNFEENIAPAIKEEGCPELYWVNLDRGTQHVLYLFCNRNSNFSLISAYEKHGGVRTRIY